MKTRTTAIVLSIIAVLTLLTTACGGGSEPPNEPRGQSESSSQAEPTTPVEKEEGTQIPAPTRPSRLTNLGTPEAKKDTTPVADVTGQPTRTATTGDETPRPGNTPAPGETPTVAPTGPMTIEDMVPENPQNQDKVLIQDIYAKMDLEEFALDPNEPLVYEEDYPQKFEMAQIKDHPYLHIFRGLQYAVQVEEQARKPKLAIEYNPYYDGTPSSPQSGNPSGSGTRSQQFFQNFDHITHFIYNPWFERLYIIPKGTRVFSDSKATKPVIEGLNQEGNSIFTTAEDSITPFWFGDNSTRGVLADTIAQLLEDAAKPTAKATPITWQIGYQDRAPTVPNFAEKTWDLDEYVRMTTSRAHEPRGLPDHYRAPQIHWEFIHTKLPIIKITAHNKVKLPLATPAQTELTNTKYSVAFVVSLQNRWESLTNPNRWIARFQEDFANYEKGVNSKGDYLSTIGWEKLFHPLRHSNRPNRSNQIPEEFLPPSSLDHWHHTDYMQHRLIGPVVVTVHESDVIKTGTYSMTPRVTHWEAPGYVATDEQLKAPFYDQKATQETREQNKDRITAASTREERRAITDSLKVYVQLFTINKSPVHSPNVNWPLPGHVLTGNQSHPGTEIWDSYDIDDHDW